MNKKVITLVAALTLATPVFADGNAFTPLNFDDVSTSKNVPAKNITTSPKDIPVSAEDAIGNGNIQNAILEIDNAQVDIRNELLNYKTKYSDVDAQYKLIKNERSMLHKQVRSTEKRIKDLDRAKEKIRKNML